MQVGRNMTGTGQELDRELDSHWTINAQEMCRVCAVADCAGTVPTLRRTCEGKERRRHCADIPQAMER